ncbi:MAG TPA: hypothetical protein VIJ14_00425, partial [Rhabdochlamydiaceae bacterium]
VFSAVSADTETDEDKFRSWVFEKYRLSVTEVDPEHHCFKLSNKLVYNIPKKNWGADALPEVGDRVALTPIVRLHSHRSSHTEQGELSVDIRGPDGQLPSKGNVNVWISGESEYQLYFVGVNSVYIEWSWWNDIYKEVIVLSDGSGWIRTREDESKFSPGDRIIVSKLSDKEYILIDLDQNIHSKVSAGKTFGMLAFEKVEPFNRKKVTKE